MHGSEQEWCPITPAWLCTPGVIHVVRVPLRTSTPLHPEDWKTLSADEVARAERYRFEEPRRRFVRMRRTLRHLLSARVDRPPEQLTFLYGLHGKPQLEDAAGAGDFSVSHSGEWGLIALAPGGLIGADVEHAAERVSWPGLARRFFAAREVDELFALPPERQLAGFYRIWTGKEAFIKGLGRGLSYPLGRFAVAANPDQPAALLAIDDEPEAVARWQAQAVNPAFDYAATVLWEGPAMPVWTGEIT